MVAGPQPTPEFVPNRDRAEVPPAKVSGYLLDATHPDGAPKAAFFMAFGFTAADPTRLSAALLTHIRKNPATGSTSAPFGTMYIVDAPLPGPDGRAPMVRSVWIIESSSDRPRLVTAYPAPGRGPD